MHRNLVFFIDREGNNQSQRTPQDFANVIGRHKGVSSSIPLDISRDDVYVIRVSHIEIDVDGYRLGNLINYVQRLSGDVGVITSVEVYNSNPNH
jgi:hypothetical protein